MNITFLRGQLSSPPRRIELPSGDTALSLELTIRTDGSPTDTVPVAWFAAGRAAGAAEQWAPGTELVVVGRVRRRFFRAGGRTASRTEVLATSVIPTARRAAAAKAISQALGQLDAAL